MALSRGDRRDELAERAVSLGVPLRRELKANREIVLEAVTQNALTLESAAAELKEDHEIVLEAVKQSGGLSSMQPWNFARTAR